MPWDGIVNALKGFNVFFSALTDKGFWMRVAVGSLGVGFIFAGLAIIVSANKEVQKIVGTAAKAGLTSTPVGKAAVAAETVAKHK